MHSIYMIYNFSIFYFCIFCNFSRRFAIESIILIILFMLKQYGIISFDLMQWSEKILDISSFFPISELHPIRSTKPLLDTIYPRRSPTPDLSFPRILSVPRFHSFHTLDIGYATLAYKRGLVDSPPWEKRWYTIDLFPTLSIPYGAIDVRWEPIKSEKRYSDLYRRSLPWSLHARRIVKGSSKFLRKKRRPILLSLCILFGLTVPMLLYTKSLIEHAYDDLLSLKNITNQSEALSLIESSRGNFERANLLFMPFRIFPWENIALARIALDGWLSLTRGLDHIVSDIPRTLSWETISRLVDPSDSLYRPIATDIRPLISLGISEPTSWMRDHHSSIVYLSESLKEAGKKYSEADAIDHPKSQEIAHIGRGLSKVSELLEYYIAHESDILALLWSDTPERYMVLNQNRDEIRANGGFPGSVITFTIFHGNIEDYRTDDVYYYDWNLYPFKEMPPPWLALISGNYGLRDVNYYPDFRETLEKANTFIEKSGDPTVTIGIALHQWLIEDLLKVVWPVSLSGITEPFRSENFSLLMSTLVESRYDEETSAKDVLRKFVDNFAKKIYEKRAYEEVINILQAYITDGEILFASRNDKIDRYLSTLRKPLPWEKNIAKNNKNDIIWNIDTSGASIQIDILPSNLSWTNLLGSYLTGENWVYPLLTSLSGNKSDRLIERSYTAETTNIGSCKYLNKLSFTHKHTYTKLVEIEIRKYLAMIGVRDTTKIEKMLTIQWRGKNIAYMRVLVPKSASLTGSTAWVTVSQLDRAQEFVFSLDTPIGWTASKTFRYMVDIPGCDRKAYPVSWYRQPWLQKTKMKSK